MSNSLFINGVWLQGSGATFEKTNPVDNQTVWSGAEATATDVEQACQAARTAFPA
ncbi:aldehyde dehydrogenase family protein, partial [Acinetobacter baumannii]